MGFGLLVCVPSQPDPVIGQAQPEGLVLQLKGRGGHVAGADGKLTAWSASEFRALRRAA